MTLPNVPPIPASKTSGLAISSLILGCFGLLLSCLTGIPAIICGIMAHSEIGKNPNLGGKGMATAGIVLGGVSMLMIPVIGILAGLAVPAISVALDKAKQTQEVAELRQVGLMFFAYANDHNGKYPDSLEVLLEDKTQPADYLERLLYKKNTREIRWILTPGLTTASPPETVLIRSAESMGRGRNRGHATFTVGGHTQWQKE